MQRIVRGAMEYQDRVFNQDRGHFQGLLEGQRPEALFVTCSDSRIDPELLTQSEPGRIFLMRNAGNIVPRYRHALTSEAGTIELAVAALGIQHIIICGHTCCAAVSGIVFPERMADLPILGDWLTRAETEYDPAWVDTLDRNAPPPLKAVEQHVVAQLHNLKTHPSVAYARASKRITLHGWVYHLEDGRVTAYDESRGAFLSLDEAYPDVRREPVA